LALGCYFWTSPLPHDHDRDVECFIFSFVLYLRWLNPAPWSRAACGVVFKLSRLPWCHSGSKNSYCCTNNGRSLPLTLFPPHETFTSHIFADSVILAALMEAQLSIIWTLSNFFFAANPNEVSTFLSAIRKDWALLVMFRNQPLIPQVCHLFPSVIIHKNWFSDVNPLTFVRATRFWRAIACSSVHGVQ
jgi:hypothetical protein